MFPVNRLGVNFGILAWGLLGCSSVACDKKATKAEVIELPELFSMDHLVQIEMELAPSDWELLRQEGRDLVGVFSHSQFEYDFTYFHAAVTVDGVRYGDVGLRKKGYWGSLSTTRPSFKVDFDQYQPGVFHRGLEKLTLNNDRGDLSRTHECMSYALFARGGVPAPRCNLAHVVVNGVDLGTYSNVESIDKKMLARNFSNNDGNLYEGQRADFLAADLDRMELKTNKSVNDRSDLNALVDALQADNAVVVEQLAAIVDLERFRNFWAMEMLVGHWDGYTNNANNYLMYNDPGSGLFQFLPWGTDNTFERGNPRGRIYARGRLASRLYAIPEQKRLFWKRLAELTDTVWDEKLLLGYIELVDSFAPDAPDELLQDERRFVSSRLGSLLTVLDGEPPRARRRATSPCAGTVGSLKGTFTTAFEAGVSTTPGAFSASLSLDGEVVTGVTWSGQATMEERLPDPVPSFSYVGVLANDREISLKFYVGPRLFRPGNVRFHGGETYGNITVREAGVEQSVGIIGNGSIEFTQAQAEQGSPLSGSFVARIYQFNCAWR